VVLIVACDVFVADFPFIILQAMLGGKVEVPTLNGKTEVKVIIDSEKGMRGH
jgi:DnaJ-class molecular chaperone